jgi:hypothetical protein
MVMTTMDRPLVKLCGEGATRRVVLLGPLALKLPRARYGWAPFLRGLLCNMQEVAFSGTGWPELCPVLWRVPGGFLVVMRRARPLTDAEWFGLDVAGFKYGPDYDVPVECKRDSFGVVDGRVVAVDYGS